MDEEEEQKLETDLALDCVCALHSNQLVKLRQRLGGLHDQSGPPGAPSCFWVTCLSFCSCSANTTGSIPGSSLHS